MGGALIKPLRRVATNFNVESRAHRYIDKEIVRPSPKHPSTAEKIAQFQADNPQILEKQQQRDDRLLGMLKDVKVVSSEVQGKRLMNESDVEEVRKKPRTLPQNRRSNPGSPSVFLEADTVPEGRLSVGKAMELLARHKKNKQENTAEVLAQEYRLDLEDTKKILEHFQVFKLIPVIDEKNMPRITKGS